MAHFHTRSNRLLALRSMLAVALVAATVLTPAMAMAEPASAPVRAAGLFAAVSLDTTPPVTYSDVLSSYDGVAVIQLFSFDADSGVAHTYFKLDDGAQTEGDVVNVTTRGDHVLEFWSVDAAGNIETPHVFAPFYVNIYEPDHTAPVTTCNAVATYLAQALITLSADDNEGGSGVASTHFKLDNGAEQEGLTVMTNVIGAHTLQYWSVDHENNIEATKTATFTVTPNKTAITIRTSSASARIGGVPILSGAVTPVGVVGKIMVVYVMKPGSARWTYSSNRVIYSLRGTAAWQYKYYFKPGMRKGVYRYKAVLPASSPYPGCTSPNIVSITLR